MGKLEHFQLDDKMVETDTLKYVVSSTAVFILVPTDHCQETRSWAVLFSQWLLCSSSSKFSFAFDINRFWKGRMSICLTETLCIVESETWGTESQRLSYLPIACDMALVFELWLWGGITEQAENTAGLLELWVSFRKPESSSLTFSNSGGVSPVTLRWPGEEQAQDESDSLIHQTLCGSVPVPAGLRLWNMISKAIFCKEAFSTSLTPPKLLFCVLLCP